MWPFLNIISYQTKTICCLTSVSLPLNLDSKVQGQEVDPTDLSYLNRVFRNKKMTLLYNIDEAEQKISKKLKLHQVSAEPGTSVFCPAAFLTELTWHLLKV